MLGGSEGCKVVVKSMGQMWYCEGVGRRKAAGLVGIGGVIVAFALAAFLTWDFWFWGTANELSGRTDDSGHLPFEVSSHHLIFDIGAGGSLTLKPRKALQENAEVRIELDDPTLVNTISSFTVKAGVRRPIFIPVHAKQIAGHCVLSFKSDSEELDKLFKIRIQIKVVHEIIFGYLSILLGWGYFAVWNCSYYPQIFQNWKRKSVVGLSFDWLSLNFTGHLCYCVFNVAMYFNNSIQREYTKLHPKGELPVKVNDSYFSMHAVMMNIVLIIQCCLYERGNQKLALPVIALVGGLWATMACGLMAAIMEKITWLQYLYYLSYIKVGSTPIKYTPQVYLNYIRKSTEGWSIYSVFLDGLGGILSLMQMVVDAFNNDDWDGTLGNPGKLGLSLISMAYNVVFLVQHFILFPQPYATPRKRRITDDHKHNNFTEKLEHLKASFQPLKKSASLSRVYDL